MLSVASILAESATRAPDRVALYFRGEALSYGELWSQTRAYAGALRELGIGRGDRVAVLIPNVPDFARVYYAVLALGAIVVPIHLLFKANEIEYVLRDSGADLVVAASSSLAEALPAARDAAVDLVTVLAPPPVVYVPAAKTAANASPATPATIATNAAGSGATPPVAAALGTEPPSIRRLEDLAGAAVPIARHEPVRPMDAATILYTSGTTGTPKGSVGSHLAIVEQVHNSLIDSLDILPDDVIFGGLPLFHTFGQTAVLNTGFRRGAAIILLPKFDAAEAIELMVLHRATVFEGVPTMYIALIEAAAARVEARPPLRFAVSGGAALPVAVLEKFAETFGAEVHEGYGLTETSSTVSVNSRYEKTRPGTVGRPLWGVEVAVAEPEVEGRIELLPDAGAVGEIVVRGYNVFNGYLGRPDASADAVVDGWLRTGDLGTLSADGFITIVDRKKDLIVRNGYNVYPTEVEAVLARHAAVSMVAVFGVPDDVHGQEVHAAVVTRVGETVEPNDLIAFACERMAAYKFPRVVHFVTELPLGPSGKVLKRVLTERFAAAV
ncbi:AMP-binding protein [Subtercola lobariae]|nr:AMP-binding protein [Subtercola lobariae]